jgi:hypothetical protein
MPKVDCPYYTPAKANMQSATSATGFISSLLHASRTAARLETRKCLWSCRMVVDRILRIRELKMEHQAAEARVAARSTGERQ